MKKLLFILSFVVYLNTQAQTTINPGYVHGTWTLAGSPYLIQGSVMVPNDSTLTIQPGVTINFQGHYKLLVGGRLLAIGSATDSIYFTASNTTTGWYGIRFDTTHITNDTSKFYYCSVKYGNANGTGVDAYGGAFMFNSFSKAIISNCLIKNCSAIGTYGGGIYCASGSPGSPIIKNNIVSFCNGTAISFNGTSSGNVSNNNITYNTGAGISGCGNNTVVYNNIISHNSAGMGANGGTVSYNTITFNISNSNLGGGIYCESSSTPLKIFNNIISNNASQAGGGIFCYICSATITDNIISNNSSYSGAGIYAGAGQATPIISNNIIVNNMTTGTAGQGGGIIVGGGATPQIINNTIVNNLASEGGGIYFSGSVNPSIFNTIVYGNTSTSSGDQIYINDEPSDPSFYYCDIQGGSSTFEMNGNFYSGNYNNNIDMNPLFVSPSAGSGTTYNGTTADWTLQNTSPCINTGNPSGTYPATDLAGNPRVYGSSIDMGAYEYQGFTGIKNYSEQDKFIIYPNPSTGIFTVETNSTSKQTMQVYDVNGRIIPIPSPSQREGNKLTIDLSNLPAGVYNINLTSNEGVINKRVVIAR